jgi:hypothetical protein
MEEIHRVLDSLKDEGKDWDATWIAHAICKAHEKGLASNGEAEFWRHCGYAEARDRVRRAIGERAAPEKPEDEAAPESRQYVLPGFEHMRTHYVVERDGERVGVFVYNMTEDELAQRAAFYRSMGAACYAHADELDRFRRSAADSTVQAS